MYLFIFFFLSFFSFFLGGGVGVGGGGFLFLWKISAETVVLHVIRVARWGQFVEQRVHCKQVYYE